MKKCKKCGEKIEKGDKFCSSCGAEVKKSKWWRWCLAIVVIVIITGGSLVFFYSGDDDADVTKREPTTEESLSSTEKEESEEKEIEKRLMDNPDFLAAAVSRYGYNLNKHYDSWKEKVTRISDTKLTSDYHNTEKGDGIYHNFDFTDGRSANSGYVVSKDKQTIYLYMRTSVGGDEKPMGTITVQELAKEVISNGVDEVSKRADEMAKAKSSSGSKLKEQQKVLATYMDGWQKAMGQEYEENNVDPGSKGINMGDMTIVNQLTGKASVLLSINAKFVDVSIDKPSKQGYQIIAAYTGTSDNAKNYRYLFVMHDGKPEVLVAHMPEAVGSTDRGDAINFVPTKNDALPGAFKQIMETGKAPKAPEKPKNVVNSLDDAKAIYREIFGEDAIEGPVPNNEAHSGKWEVKSNGDYYYYCGDNYAGDYMSLIVHPNGSVNYRNFCHSYIDISSSCTYEDIKNGDAKDILQQELK